MENWKPIVGWEHFYEVSDRGRVRNMADRPHTYVGKILKPNVPPVDSRGRKGYLRVYLSRPGQRHVECRVHKLVAEAFLGPCLEGMEVNHIDGDKTNPRLENLEYVTPRENNLHARQVLRTAMGESHGNSVLTEKTVAEIVQQLEAGRPHKAIASDFGVCREAVSRIAQGKAWKHVTGGRVVHRSRGIKLDASTVATIKCKLNAGSSMYGLAKDYSVCPESIRKIRDGETWKNIMPA